MRRLSVCFNAWKLGFVERLRLRGSAHARASLIQRIETEWNRNGLRDFLRHAIKRQTPWCHVLVSFFSPLTFRIHICTYMERIVNDVVLRSIDGVEFREDVKLRQRTGTADRSYGVVWKRVRDGKWYVILRRNVWARVTTKMYYYVG